MRGRRSHPFLFAAIGLGTVGTLGLDAGVALQVAPAVGVEARRAEAGHGRSVAALIGSLRGRATDAGSESPAIQGESRPFTIEDSLSLELIRFSAASGISPDGEYLAYAWKNGFQNNLDTSTAYRLVPRGNYVFVQPVDGEDRIQITRGEEFSWSPSWSPDGRRLAFYVWHDGKIRIGVWDRTSGRTEHFTPENLTGRWTLEWSPAGDEVLYFSSEFDGFGPIWPYEDDERVIVRASWEEDSYEERFIGFRESQLWALAVDDGSVRPIVGEQTNFYSHAVSPDGRWVAASVLTRWVVLTHLVPSYVDLRLYAAEGVAAPGGRPSGGDASGPRPDSSSGRPDAGGPRSGAGEEAEVRTIFADRLMTTPYAWAPDSRSIAYVEEGGLWRYDIESAESMPMGPADAGFQGAPQWRPGGGAVLCRAGGDFYLIDSGTGAARRLPLDLELVVRQVIWDPDGRFLYAKVLEDASGRQGIYRVEVESGSVEELLIGNWMVSELRLVGNRLFFTLQKADMPVNIWSLDLQSGQRQQLTSFNEKFADRTLGTTSLVHWTSLAGDPLKGVLLYPVGYQEGTRYPVVFWVYETFSGNLHRFGDHIYNLQVLANNGYAVFLPDVKFTEGKSGRSFEESLVAAMDRLEEMGIADGNFGVMGRSYGGFATNIIVTRTPRFKAAISLVGITDWVSKYRMQGVFWRRGDRIGQGRLGGHLWDVPEAFIENSPMFHLDKVETPIMLLHGTHDRNVHFSQAEQMYYGLRDLGKTAILVAYPNETHLGWDAEEWVLIDIWQRILAWFDRYLK